MAFLGVTFFLVRGIYSHKVEYLKNRAWYAMSLQVKQNVGQFYQRPSEYSVPQILLLGAPQ